MGLCVWTGTYQWHKTEINFYKTNIICQDIYLIVYQEWCFINCSRSCFSRMKVKRFYLLLNLIALRTLLLSPCHHYMWNEKNWPYDICTICICDDHFWAVCKCTGGDIIYKEEVTSQLHRKWHHSYKPHGHVLVRYYWISANEESRNLWKT